ncbi:MAG: carboxymuconolactone decarboxylase family protein [Gemmatimonadaceae bacterium]
MRHLVRIAGAIAGSDEGTVRAVMIEAVNGGPARGGNSANSRVDAAAVDEIILQSYLFAGFPRALNAARTWRSVSGTTAPKTDPESDAADLETWRERGLATCEIVYGESYERLRRNIRGLHPALDEWMIVDGYGKVLSRPGVDLRTRELCVVAACAVAGQQRQLHSHLGGAMNAGASFEEVAAVLEAVKDLMSREDLARYHQLLVKVQGQ